MKNLFYLLTALLVFFSCKKESEIPSGKTYEAQLIFSVKEGSATANYQLEDAADLIQIGSFSGTKTETVTLTPGKQLSLFLSSSNFDQKSGNLSLKIKINGKIIDEMTNDDKTNNLILSYQVDSKDF